MSEWIEWKWTEEKPYPETLETKIKTKRLPNEEDEFTYQTVGWWYGDGSVRQSNFRCVGVGLITHYKVVE